MKGVDTMIKKYDCWESLKESFSADDVFECEGEIFVLSDTHIFLVGDTDECITVHIENYSNGVIVSVVFSDACTQYMYRKVEYV